MSIIKAQSNQVAIANIFAREILDSRGIPTIECSLALNSGVLVVTSVSTANEKANHQLKELRDQDENRMSGLGVRKAVALINTKIAPLLIGKNPINQEEIDQILASLDASKNKSVIGSNTTMVVSQAVLKAAALSYGWPPYYYIFKKYGFTKVLSMPTCIYGMIDGGRHGTDNLDFQEFQIIPANNLSYERSIEIAVMLFRVLGQILKEKGAIRSVGPNGGYTPNLYKNTDAFDLLTQAAKAVDLTVGRDIFFGADLDSDSFYKGGNYRIKDRTEPYNTKQWLAYLQDLNKLYGIYSFEDPFASDDIPSWKEFNLDFGRTTRVICDTLTRSNPKNTQIAIKESLGNTLLIKTGQVATFSELIETIKLAKEANWQLIVANREGETNDDLLADLGVGLGSEFVKFGPPNRGERIVKFNRLLQISQELKQLTRN